MTKKILWVIFLTTYSFITFAGPLIDRISSNYMDVKTIRGSFTQTSIFQDGKKITYKGKFTIKEGSSEWIYTYPEKQKIITKGKEVYIIKDNNIEKAELLLNTQIYSDIIKNIKLLSKEFNIIEKDNKIIMIPIDKNKGINKIIIITTSNNPKTIEVEDIYGNRIIMNISIREVERK